MINIFNNYTEVPFDYETIVHDVEKGFIDFFNLDKQQELSLILVNNDAIKEINREYRKKDSITDVISFEDHDEENYLGDIFISIDRAIEQATTYGHSVNREFAFLLCHGCLHLLGYDHLNEVDEKEMFSKQEEILNKIGYTR